ncbi:MAG: hypothetical protein U0V74_03275 [Chitinophagales bacterium]
MRSLMMAILIMAFLGGSAQGRYALVYFKGVVQTSSDKKLWLQQNRIGSTVNDNEVVKLEDKSEAIYSGPKGEVVHLKQAGNYAVSDFASLQAKGNQQSFAAYYVKYVAGEIAHHHNDIEEDYKGNLRNLGGVSRGHGELCLLTPRFDEVVIDSAVTFTWHNFSSVKDYTFIIFSDSLLEQQMVVRDVPDTTTTVVVKGFPAGKTYYWKAESRTRNNCLNGQFRLADSGEKKSLSFQHKEMLQTLTYTKALNKLTEAGFYIDKGVYSRAEKCFADALKLEPNNESIKQAYEAFRTTLYQP